MLIGLLLIIISNIYILISIKGIKGIKNKINKEGYFPIYTWLILSTCMCLVIGLFVGVITGMSLFRQLDKYDTYLIESIEIDGYTKEEVFTLGVTQYRNATYYLYNIKTAQGNNLERIYSNEVFIQNSKDKPVKELHGYKIKNPLIRFTAINMRESYVILKLPEDYKIIEYGQ